MHTPFVVKQPLSPGEFLGAQRRFRLEMSYENQMVDIDGQLENGQYATASVSARSALEEGLIIHLLVRGDVGVTGSNVWTILRRRYEEDGPVFRAARALFFRNPMTLDEVREYARDCRAFVESTLGVSPSGYRTPESFSDYKRNVKGIQQLARLVSANGWGKPQQGTRRDDTG